MAATARRHETRALLRAHLSAASGYRHLTRHCPICHRLQRLAMERCDADAETDTDETPGANSRPL
jgi:hypothetical protein